MVVIRVNASIRPESAKIIVEGIHAQASTGVIVLPECCELLNELPADEEIQVIHQDARVAELERELAAAMAYISAVKDCCTCKHEMGVNSACPADCECCDGEPCAHLCRVCIDGSKWEWRGTYGRE